MKLKVELDLEEVLGEEELDQIIKEEIVDRIVTAELNNFHLSKERYNWGDLETRMNERIDRIVAHLETKKYEDVLEKLVHRIESKRDYLERVLRVKDFTELSKENEDYIIELIDKAIAKKFK